MTIKSEIKDLKQYNKQFRAIFNSYDSWHDKELEADIVMEHLRLATLKMVDKNNRPVHKFFYREAVDQDLYSINHKYLTYPTVHSIITTLIGRIKTPDRDTELLRNASQTDWNVVRQKK